MDKRDQSSDRMTAACDVPDPGRQLPGELHRESTDPAKGAIPSPVHRNAGAAPGRQMRFIV